MSEEMPNGTLFRTYLDGELTGHWLVIAYAVAGMAFVGRLLNGQFHIPIGVLLDGVQYPVGPGRPASKMESCFINCNFISKDYSLHIVIIGAMLELERWWKLW